MTDTIRTTQPLQRMPSGIPGLDDVLQGGFFLGGLYLIMGQPGTGKTIFSNQLCFHQVANGKRVVYVTLLAETHARMLMHLQSLDFFSTAPIAESLYYVSGYRVLEQSGVEGLLGLLRQVIRDHRASMLVIDGVVTAESVAGSELAFKRFINELQVYIEATNCTTFLSTQPDPAGNHPEHTMVDGLIELTDRRIGLRSVREIEVRKFRGSDYLRGRHLFNITNKGITVYPRTETLYAMPSHIASEDRRRETFGIPSLDEMLQGGIHSASTTMVLGGSGSGKTLLGLHFLAQGAAQQEPGLCMGFHETPARLVGKGDSIGLNVAPAVRDGLITTMWQPPHEDSLDALAQQLLQTIEEKQIKRLVIDSINALQQTATYPERMTRFFGTLTAELNGRGVTTLLIAETPRLFDAVLESPIQNLSVLTENIIVLRYVELRSQLYRLISVMKMRESAHDPAIREFKLTNKGIVVAASFESAEAILTGVAHATSSATRKATGDTRRKRSQ